MLRRNALLLAGALAPLLSGCVAAALPLVAAGAVARREAMNDDRGTNQPVVEVLPGADPQPALTPTPAAPAIEPVAASSPPVAPTANEAAVVDQSGTMDNGIPPISAAPPPPADAMANIADTAEDSAAGGVSTAGREPIMAGPVLAPAIVIPVRDAATALPAPVVAMAGDAPYDGFIRFAMQQADRREDGRLRETVMLSGPPLNGSLSLMPCGFLPPAVIVDLDDGGVGGGVGGGIGGTDGGLNLSTVTVDTPVRAAAGLAEGLNELRRRDVAVIWMTSQPVDRLTTLSTLLQLNGLNPAGRDAIVLTRTSGERKQERRTQTAASHCILAIAGDRKADFDELYDYLRNPDSPTDSDRMIGAGWFLAPPPLAAAETAATPQP